MHGSTDTRGHRYVLWGSAHACLSVCASEKNMKVCMGITYVRTDQVCKRGWRCGRRSGHHELDPRSLSHEPIKMSLGCRTSIMSGQPPPEQDTQNKSDNCIIGRVFGVCVNTYTTSSWAMCMRMVVGCVHECANESTGMRDTPWPDRRRRMVPIRQ